MSRTITGIEKAIVVLVTIAIIISASTLIYATSIMGQLAAVSELTTGLAELTTAELELATELAKLATSVGASVEAIHDIEERLLAVEERLVTPRTIRLGTFAGPYEDFVRAIADVFEEENPGVTVDIVTVNYDEEWLAKLRLWAGKPAVDVMYITTSTLIKGVAEDFFEEIRAENIPVYDDLYPIATEQGVIDGKLYGLGYDLAQWGIVYHTENCPTPPTKFMDLWDPSFGPVGLEAWPFWDLYAAAAAWDMDITTDLDAVFEKLKELKAQGRVTFYESYAEFAERLQKGECYYGGVWDGRAFTYKEEGIPVEFVAPEEGGIAWIGLLAIAKGTKDRLLAEQLINHILRPDSQLMFTKAIHYGPTNSKVVLPPDLAAAVIKPEDIPKLIMMDFAFLAENMEYIYDKFNKEILAG